MRPVLLFCVLAGCSIDHTGLGPQGFARDAATDEETPDVYDSGPFSGPDARRDPPIDIGVDTPDMGPNCTDALLNGDESDTDCGGDCSACLMGATCRAGSDCRTQHCDPDGSLCRLPQSCLELLSEDAALATGAFAIDPGDNGVPFAAWCDMDYAGGGWTLVVSNDSGGGASTAGEPLPGTTQHLSRDRLRPLALGATQVHIRTSGQADTRSVTSAPGSPPIENLRAFNMLEVINAGPSASDSWSGPMLSHIQYSCSPLNLDYPSVFHACGNSRGIHWYNSRAEWAYQISDEALELYVR
jgi:hypothetical protein